MEDKEPDSDQSGIPNIVDLMRDDKESGSKKNWKAFRDKIRLKRAGRVWKSSVPIPASDIPIKPKSNRMMIRRGSSRYTADPDHHESDGEATRHLGDMPDRQRSSRLLPVETDPEEEEEKNSPDDEQKQSAGEGNQQIPLMSLLSDSGSNYNEDPDPDANAEVEEEEDIGDCNVCCGCRAKHKGESLRPCGHTFCKHCTKERLVTRGICPTCNSYLLEILDIY